MNSAEDEEKYGHQEQAYQDAMNVLIFAAVAKANSEGMPNKADILIQLQAMQRGVQHFFSQITLKVTVKNLDKPIQSDYFMRSMAKLGDKVSWALTPGPEPEALTLITDLQELYIPNLGGEPLRFYRKKGLFKDSFELDEKHLSGGYISLNRTINVHNYKNKETIGTESYLTLGEAEIVHRHHKIVGSVHAAYHGVLDKMKLKENEESDNNKRLTRYLSIVLNNSKGIKNLSHADLIMVLRECTPNYKDVLRYLIKHDLSDKLKQHLYLEEDIYINDFFSPESEAQLPLKELWSHLATVLSQKQ